MRKRGREKGEGGRGEGGEREMEGEREGVDWYDGGGDSGGYSH